jgi:hypothetical protein
MSFRTRLQFSGVCAGTIVSLIVSCATAHAAATKFDLHCKGVETEIGTRKHKPWETWLKVDLDSRQWCNQGCPEVRRIVDVMPDKIVFMNVLEPFPSLRGTHLSTLEVNRISGHLGWEFVITAHNGEKIGNIWDASCSPSPFTGFPKTKF